MYAVNLIIVADSQKGLQKTLNCLEDYCSRWKPEVNVQKTKVTIFGNRKCNVQNIVFLYDGKQLEIVDEFKYLGIVLNFNGRFKNAINSISKQASRVMYAVLAKCRKHNLPIDFQVDYFNKTVMPIITYSSEVWGL